MIVATAGHVDHGKTTLVAALTGVDTDRLPEEKRRGISIDLGFAYLPTGDGHVIGFVDVPGHERFVHNMIAGVAAIDVGLLVVAADDGVMPQTREHVNILELLGVSRGIVVITKVDLVDGDRVAQVRDEVEKLVAGRSWHVTDIVPVSVRQGVGMDALRAVLMKEHRITKPRDELANQGFRFIVDRAFVASGSGTVVTGTVVSGTLAAGATVMVSPAGVSARVRTIQQNHQPAVVARPGQRYALNLAGLDRHVVNRGESLLSSHLHAPTDRLDVRIRLAQGYAGVLRHWTPVHFHSGATAVLARLSLTGRNGIGAGEEAFAQLLLPRTTAAFTGDRFVLRDQSARMTIAGGAVIDPFAKARRRGQDSLPRLLALASEPLEIAFDRLLDATPEGVDLERFGKRFALSEAQLQRLANGPEVTLIRAPALLAFRRTAIDDMTQRILAALATYHQHKPEETGVPQAELYRATSQGFPAAQFDSLLKRLAERGAVEIKRERVGLPSFRPRERSEAMMWFRTIEPALLAADLSGLSFSTLVEVGQRGPEIARQSLTYLIDRAMVHPFKADRYLAAECFDRLVMLARDVSGTNSGGFTAAQFRDHAGIARNLTIELLEFLDRRGITFRVGDLRHIRSNETAKAAREGALDTGPNGPETV